MDNKMIIALGLIAGYFLFRFAKRKQENPTSGYPDILVNDKYKVKGQWDR